MWLQNKVDLQHLIVLLENHIKIDISGNNCHSQLLVQSIMTDSHALVMFLEHSRRSFQEGVVKWSTCRNESLTLNLQYECTLKNVFLYLKYLFISTCISKFILQKFWVWLFTLQLTLHYPFHPVILDGHPAGSGSALAFFLQGKYSYPLSHLDSSAGF